MYQSKQCQQLLLRCSFMLSLYIIHVLCEADILILTVLLTFSGAHSNPQQMLFMALSFLFTVAVLLLNFVCIREMLQHLWQTTWKVAQRASEGIVQNSYNGKRCVMGNRIVPAQCCSNTEAARPLG
jgi:hypothetical protein